MEFFGGMLLVLFLVFIAYKVIERRNKVNTSGPLSGGTRSGPKARNK